MSIMPYREPATGERHELGRLPNEPQAHGRGSLKMFQKRVVERCCPAERQAHAASHVSRKRACAADASTCNL